jgi:hypothetical protein
MAILRFLGIALLCFLLLNPFSKRQIANSENPVIPVLIDNSASVQLWGDTLQRKNDINSWLKELESEIDDKADLVMYSFTDSLSDELLFDFSGGITDFSSVLRDVQQNYEGRNVGGIVLYSDGNFNSGANPVYHKLVDKFPFYTIGIGDDEERKDIFIKEVFANRVLYQGNTLPVEIRVNAIACNSDKYRLKILKKGKVISQTEGIISDDKYSKLHEIKLEINDPGLNTFDVVVETDAEEYSKINNRSSFYVDVINTKKSVKIVTNGPHPDVQSLVLALNSISNLKVEVESIDEFDFKSDSLDLVIFHQIPSMDSKPVMDINSLIIRGGVSMWFILGDDSDVDALKNIETTLKKGVFVDGEILRPAINARFNLFKVNNEFEELLTEVPPLSGYRFSLSDENFDHSIIVDKKNPTLPLMAIDEEGDLKCAFTLGEGIWRWRIASYRKYQDHSIFDEYINSIVQYLLLKEEKSQFELHYKKTYDTDENVLISAEVYNKAYEPIGDQEVNLELIDEAGKKFTYQIPESQERYSLNLGRLSPGTYQIKGSTLIDTILFEKKGAIVIKDIEKEFNVTSVNHQLLRNIANESGGLFFNENDAGLLAKELRDSKDIVQIEHYSSVFEYLRDYWWIMLIIALLFGTEWFLRKYLGGY